MQLQKSKKVPNLFYKQLCSTSNMFTPNAQQRLPEVQRCQLSRFDQMWVGTPDSRGGIGKSYCSDMEYRGREV